MPGVDEPAARRDWCGTWVSAGGDVGSGGGERADVGSGGCVRADVGSGGCVRADVGSGEV